MASPSSLFEAVQAPAPAPVALGDPSAPPRQPLPTPADSLRQRWRDTPVEIARPSLKSSKPRHWFGPAVIAVNHWLRLTPSWLASMLFHMTALLVLATWQLHVLHATQSEVALAPAREAPALEDLADLNATKLDLDDAKLALSPAPLDSLHSGPSLEPGPSLSPDVGGPPSAVPLNPLANDPDAGPMHVDLSPFGDRKAPPTDLLKTSGVPGGMGHGLGGRYGEAKSELIKSAGGTPASEHAVGEALKWLSIHQCADGSWNFNLEECPACKGKCKDSGVANTARNAATALALLPFLGAGETHQEGKYTKNVQDGLYYLTSHVQRQDNLMSWHEPIGNMYSHGLVSIVLSEAYAMTKDPLLLPYAKGSVEFIDYMQDPEGGGWRYRFRMPGDTSVTGWQLMALKSAQIAKLETRSSTFPLINKFLDSVQGDEGAIYGYRGPEDIRPSLSAVGLLCRMYLGWKKDNPALKRGVQLLSKRGPSLSNQADMYYNYYATQIMRHWGGPEWEQWNYKMREWLISHQSHTGHEKGSWFMDDESYAPKGIAGGRLYCTSMATMILEVYYRTLPLYSAQAVSDEFSF
jgi:hypothetical protein